MIDSNLRSISEIFASYFDDPDVRKLAFLLSQKLEEGNLCVDLELLQKNNIDTAKIINSKYITSNPEAELKPFIIKDGKLYFQKYYRYETEIIEKIVSIIKMEDKKVFFQKQKLNDNKEIVKTVFQDILQNEASILQIVAAVSAFINDFTIITGAPGTGKTSSIARFLELCLYIEPEIKVVMSAPTGKAAKRLSESISRFASLIENDEIKQKILKIEALTLHRLLKMEKRKFKKKDNPTLNYDVIIIDESSMIDVGLMATLLNSVRENSKLILLGDKNQLSSIGAGSIFGDLCTSVSRSNIFLKDDAKFIHQLFDNEFDNISSNKSDKKESILDGHIIELTHSFRFSDKKGIGLFSKDILSGNINFKNMPKYAEKHEFVKVTNEVDNPDLESLFDYYIKYAEVQGIIPAFELLSSIRILCSVREGKNGVLAFNRLIEDRLMNLGLIKPQSVLYDKQPIIITKNDYSLGLFNGDIGIVRTSEDKSQLRVYFINQDGMLISYPSSYIDDFETAYSMTIHKSQGSEFENVIIALSDVENNGFLTRELLYTAVTRAQKKVIILSDENLLKRIISNKVSRISNIKNRISTIYPN